MPSTFSRRYRRLGRLYRQMTSAYAALRSGLISRRRAETAQPVQIEISGVNSIAARGTATVLKAANRSETNSINDPQHLIPTAEKIKNLGTRFTRVYPPCSVTILELDAR